MARILPCTKMPFSHACWAVAWSLSLLCYFGACFQAGGRAFLVWETGGDTYGVLFSGLLDAGDGGEEEVNLSGPLT